MKLKLKKILLFAICLVIVFGIGSLGSLFTDTGDWYESVKPAITPPSYVFPIVWNVLFLLFAIGLYLVILKKDKKVILLFAINLVLNFLWSFLFFGLKKTRWAFLDLILLWISILLIFIYSWKINRVVSWLVLPYLLWVSFAGVLNFLIGF